ncbi:MAG: hypothetical protein ACREEC_08565, partial [Thermoplasmata archaeon]
YLAVIAGGVILLGAPLLRMITGELAFAALIAGGSLLVLGMLIAFGRDGAWLQTMAALYGVGLVTVEVGGIMALVWHRRLNEPV